MHYRLLALLLLLAVSRPAPAQTPPAPTPAPPAPLKTVLPALSPSPPPAPETGWVYLEHFTSPNGKDDFYTADGHEEDYVAGTLHYKGLGPAGWVYLGPDGAVPLYRFYSPSLGTHFYTADAAQRPAADSGWRAEGVAGYLAHGAVTAPSVTAIPAVVYVYVVAPPPVPPTSSPPDAPPAPPATPAPASAPAATPSPGAAPGR